MRWVATGAGGFIRAKDIAAILVEPISGAFSVIAELTTRTRLEVERYPTGQAARDAAETLLQAIAPTDPIVRPVNPNPPPPAPPPRLRPV